MIQQGVDSVFDTDGFTPADRARRGAFRRALRLQRAGDHGDADHRRPQRGAVNLIADGVVPSNEDRGYVLRRIMRRAIQQGRALGLEPPFLGRFAERVIELMRDAYPQLEAERETIERWVGDEEESFGRTLDRGTELLGRADRRSQAIRAPRGSTPRTPSAPRHLRLSLRPDPRAARRAGARGRRRGLRGADGGAARARPLRRRRRGQGPPRRGDQLRRRRAADPLRRLRGARARRPASPPPSRSARTAPCWSSSRRARSTPRAAARSPTPARSRWDGGEARVDDVYRVGDDQALQGGLGRARRAGVRVTARVDHGVRHATMRNHTATHLLHAALRERLGTHVRQAGSAVRPDKLRFDFTHGAPLSAEELRAVEDRVNEWIKASRPVRAMEMSRAEAETLGAMALFGEKYGDWVRVVEVDDVSRELCGGTHVANTAEIGIFAIASEGSSAANVRRIEALTGPAAIDHFRERSDELERGRRAARRAEGRRSRAARRAAAQLEELEPHGRRARPARGGRGGRRAGRRRRGPRRDPGRGCARPGRRSAGTARPRRPGQVRSSATPPSCSAAPSGGKVALVASFTRRGRARPLGRDDRPRGRAARRRRRRRARGRRAGRRPRPRTARRGARGAREAIAAALEG